MDDEQRDTVAGASAGGKHPREAVAESPSSSHLGAGGVSSGAGDGGAGADTSADGQAPPAKRRAKIQNSTMVRPENCRVPSPPFPGSRERGHEFAPASAIFLAHHVFKSARTCLGAPKGFSHVDGRMDHHGMCECIAFKSWRLWLLRGCVVACSSVRGVEALGIVPHPLVLVGGAAKGTGQLTVSHVSTGLQDFTNALSSTSWSGEWPWSWPWSWSWRRQGTFVRPVAIPSSSCARSTRRASQGHPGGGFCSESPGNGQRGFEDWNSGPCSCQDTRAWGARGRSVARVWGARGWLRDLTAEGVEPNPGPPKVKCSQFSEFFGQFCVLT